jgi:hypothetical protein
MKKDSLRALAVAVPGGPTTNIEDRIGRWLEALLQSARQPEGPISISIIHVAVDQGQRLLRSLTVETAPLDAKEMADLLDAIALEITTDAEDLGGMQRYQLKASAKGRDIGSTTIRYAMDTMPAAIDSEPPSHRGLVAQSQRHTEAAFNGSILASFQQRLVAQEEMLARYQAQALQTFKLQEELLVQKAQLETRSEEEKEEREMRMMEAIEKHQRNQLLVQTGLQRVNEVFPILLQYLFGSKAEVSDVPVENTGEGVEPTSAAESAAPANDDGVPETQTPAAPTTATKTAPLNAVEKMKVAMLLREHLLPVITERHKNKQPLFQPGDDPSSFNLARRLLVSCSAQEIAMILGGLPEPDRNAIKALADSFKISLTGAAPASATTDKPTPGPDTAKARS